MQVAAWKRADARRAREARALHWLSIAQVSAHNQEQAMSDFETIDNASLEHVNGGAIPWAKIWKGAKAVYNGLGIASTVGQVGRAIHDFFVPPAPQPQPQPQPAPKHEEKKS
jgi:hypothetical protein